MQLRLLKILAASVAIALIALTLYAGEPDQFWWWLLALPFAVWIVGPAVMPYILAQRTKRNWFSYLMLAFLSVSSVWSALVYYHAFFRSESSTAALVIIFIPAYQWGTFIRISLPSLFALRMDTDRARSQQ